MPPQAVLRGALRDSAQRRATGYHRPGRCRKRANRMRHQRRETGCRAARSSVPLATGSRPAALPLSAIAHHLPGETGRLARVEGVRSPRHGQPEEIRPGRCSKVARSVPPPPPAGYRRAVRLPRSARPARPPSTPPQSTVATSRPALAPGASGSTASLLFMAEHRFGSRARVSFPRSHGRACAAGPRHGPRRRCLPIRRRSRGPVVRGQAW
jgi:hypothetical protein